MATLINKPLCATAGTPNTGTPSCFASIDHLTQLLICYDGFEIPNASLDTDFAETLTYLQNATLNATPSTRLYPLNIIEGLTDNTAAPEKKNSGYGNTQYTSEMPHQFEIELENVGIEFFKKMRSFNGKKNVRAYWVDTAFIGGYQTATGLSPMEVTLTFKQVKVGNKQDYTKYLLDIEFKNPKALTDDLDTVSIPEGYDLKNELNGLTDVVITATKVTATSIAVTATMAISGEDFITKYEVNMSDDMFKIDNNYTSPTSVVNGIATFTVTSGTHTVSMMNPELLANLGVGSRSLGGYESNIATVNTAV